MPVYDMNDVMVCLALALRIHGTDAAVIATAYRLRPKVRRDLQPLVNKIIRCGSPGRFVEAFLREW